jgi:hypothetical protein
LTALGINADTHFKMESEAKWHQFGDHFAPKDIWEPFFADDVWEARQDGKRVGMRTLTIEVGRKPSVPGYVRIEVAPSERVTPHGIYVGVNSHFQLKLRPEDNPTALDSIAILSDHWKATREFATRISSSLIDY